MAGQTLRLEGTWQVTRSLKELTQWDAATVESIRDWQDVQLPGVLLAGLEGPEHEKVEIVWARRHFDLTAAQVGAGAALRWGGLRFGANVWVNGQFVGAHDPIGPHSLLLPPNVLHAGENELVLRVPGWAGVKRSASGFTLAPTGSGKEPWGAKSAGIFEGIWLEFFHAAHLRGVLALPDAAAGKVTFKLWLEPQNLPAGQSVDVAAQVQLGDQAVGQAQIQVKTQDTAEPNIVELSVPLSTLKLWSLSEPVTYQATVRLTCAGQLCDQKQISFGLRDIRVRDGHYELNGKRLWLRGSNLVFEWLWGPQFRDHPKEYLVDEGRRMNLNSFRTHTLPPPHEWLQVCDDHGVLILAELPVLYNHTDFKFTPEEQHEFNANALSDAANWIWELGNHPSIVMWVLTNESPAVNDAWEKGPYWQFVKALDPSRPAMRSGPLTESGTPEVVDVHTCQNFDTGSEGGVIRQINDLARRKDPARTLGNSEYMNLFAPFDAIARRWLGRSDHPEKDLIFAEFAAEHTEAMRRAQFDLILPYMFAGWTGLRGNHWRDDFPTPIAAALHSAMAPVLASLEVFDRNYLAGSKPQASLCLINELNQPAQVQVELLLTKTNPQFVPIQSALDEAFWKQSFALTLPAQSLQRQAITWPMPAEEGVYYLAAVLRRAGSDPVVSQRVVRSVIVLPVTGPAVQQGVVVLGGSAESRWILSDLGITQKDRFDPTAPPPAAVVVWDIRRVKDQDRQAAPAILAYVRQGGRVVVLDQQSWDWPELVDFKLSEKGDFLRGMSSRAFAYEQATDSPLLAGLPLEAIKRWNGLPGTIADRSLQGPALESAQKLLWMIDPNQTVLLRLPTGKGEIVLCQLLLKDRLVAPTPGSTPAPGSNRLNKPRTSVSGASHSTPAPGNELPHGSAPGSAGGYNAAPGSTLSPESSPTTQTSPPQPPDKANRAFDPAALQVFLRLLNASP
ncbi:MAG: hypothetical protein IT443_05085 [Phycisphaeraceae bacterium]|nr:hypothetical protein [Phycisphaeraceae bacterium]